MKLKVIIGFIAVISVFLLDYLPMENAILVYAIIGVSLGAFFPRVNRWAQQGIANVVGGVIIAIFVGQVLPSFIDTAVEGSTGFDVVIIKSIPYVLKAAIIWRAIYGLVEKLRRILRRR